MISARNQIRGTVAEGIGITSTISMEAVKDLGLAVGQKATAIIKATSVMIAC